jgi:steroid 5-alpha reductase family enzyme
MQSRPERLLLGGVTLWAGYRVASAATTWRAQQSRDDPKYNTAKKEEGFWNKALVTYYLPEAAVATIVALPFTAPFRHQGAVMTGYHPILQSTAVGLYTAGFALEVLADYQTKQHKESTSFEAETVWSVLSNPKYVSRFHA